MVVACYDPAMDQGLNETDEWVDPVIEAYKPGVDVTLIRENLRLTVEQRIENLQRHMWAIEEMQKAGRAARGEQ